MNIINILTDIILFEYSLLFITNNIFIIVFCSFPFVSEENTAYFNV